MKSECKMGIDDILKWSYKIGIPLSEALEGIDVPLTYEVSKLLNQTVVSRSPLLRLRHPFFSDGMSETGHPNWDSDLLDGKQCCDSWTLDNGIQVGLFHDDHRTSGYVYHVRDIRIPLCSREIMNAIKGCDSNIERGRAIRKVIIGSEIGELLLRLSRRGGVDASDARRVLEYVTGDEVLE